MNLDVNLINPFITATVTALETMAMCKPDRTGVHLKEDNELVGDISGVMGLSGEVSGSIVVSFSKDAACKVIGNMLGTEYNDLNDEVRDGIQEVVNLIAGQAKTQLAGTEYHFKVSIPTTITGSGHTINHQKGVPCIVAEFAVFDHPFSVEVSIAPKK